MSSNDNPCASLGPYHDVSPCHWYYWNYSPRYHQLPWIFQWFCWDYSPPFYWCLICYRQSLCSRSLHRVSVAYKYKITDANTIDLYDFISTRWIIDNIIFLQKKATSTSQSAQSFSSIILKLLEEFSNSSNLKVTLQPLTHCTARRDTYIMTPTKLVCFENPRIDDRYATDRIL